MSSLGLMGAIGGIGKSMSQYADTTTKDHLEQMKENRLREYQNGVRAEERSYQEGIRAEERGYQEERDKLNREHEKGLLSMRLSGKADASPPKLQKGFNPDTGKVGFFYLNESKQPVFVEGVEAPPTSSDSDPTQELFDPDKIAAEKYAKERVDEMAGFLSSDESDFARWGGSRAAAEQDFINEWYRLNNKAPSSKNINNLLQQRYGE